jgi:hypothetical protein
MLIIIEGMFLAGFITFRWDKQLLMAYLLFFVGGWLIFNIYNFENLLFLLTLKPVVKFIGTFTRPQSPEPVHPAAVT